MIRLDEQFPPLKGGVAERPRAQQDMAELLVGSNVWFDESRGLTRRPAMRLVSRAISGAYDNADEVTYTWGDTTISTSAYNDGAGGTVRDTFELEYEFRGEQYALFVMKGALGPSDAPVYAVRKSDGRRIVAPIPSTGVAAALANGVNAAAVVGDLLILAPRASSRPDSHPTYTVARPWAVRGNQQNLAAWVRGGAFARPYRLTLVRGDTRMWVQYTTLSEAYPAKLDTSGIPTTDPEYSKKVNDLTNAYNAAATAWLAAALADITPENIAGRLAAAVNASGFLAPGATATATGASVLISDPSIEEVFAEDGGDGSLMLAAGNTIPSAGAVVAFHLPGKILRVLPGGEGGSDSFYLKAVAKDGSQGAMTQVSWEECAGEELVEADYFVYGAMSPAASPSTYPEGRLHLALSIAALNAAAGTDFPAEAPNVSGDMTTNPPPPFYSKEITAMAAFQDRLVVVCAGGAVSASQPGDYLNFFRTSMLTALPRDPVSFTIIGGEGDTVRHVVKYDRNLLLIGQKQYMIPGRSALAPGQAAASIFSAVPGMDTVEPVVQSGMVFFARYSGGRTTVHAMVAGRVVEDPQVVDLTTQAPNLISERPVKLLATATPEAVLLVTESPSACYLVTTVLQRGQLIGGAVWPWALTVPTESVPASGGSSATLLGPLNLEALSNGTLNPEFSGETYPTTGSLGPIVRTGGWFIGQTGGITVTGNPEGVSEGPPLLNLDDSAAFITTDSSRPSGQQKALSGTPSLNGPVALSFSYGVSKVTVNVGTLNNVGSIHMRAWAQNGTLLGEVFSTITGFEDLVISAAGIRAVVINQIAPGADTAGYTVGNIRMEVGSGSPTPGPTAKSWSVVGIYEHRGAINYLWQARTLTGSSSPYSVATAYHLASLDFRARVDFAGWWGSRLGALPFTGYGDLDTFSVLSSWDGSFEARADLVPPTRYTDKGFTVPIPSTGLGATRQRHPLTLVTYRVHYNDTSYAKSLLGSAVWWHQAAVNPGASLIADGGWALRQDSGTPGSAPATTATADFLSAIPVGRLVHQAGVSLRSVGKHPFTISGVQWTGALHTRSDRG